MSPIMPPMMSCKEIVKLVSSGEPQPFLKKAELRMHLMMCKHCSRYVTQLQMLSRGFKKLFQVKTQVDPSQVEKLEKQIIETTTKKAGA